MPVGQASQVFHQVLFCLPPSSQASFRRQQEHRALSSRFSGVRVVEVPLKKRNGRRLGRRDGEYVKLDWLSVSLDLTLVTSRTSGQLMCTARCEDAGGEIEMGQGVKVVHCGPSRNGARTRDASFGKSKGIGLSILGVMRATGASSSDTA